MLTFYPYDGTGMFYRLAELEKLPTLCIGQADDLKIDKPGKYRVWLSRCGQEDGEPSSNKVTIEVWENDRWRVVETYEAR